MTQKTEKVSSLKNALRVMNLFTMDKKEISVSEISTQLGIGLSTAHRLATTLMAEGFLVRDPLTKNYRLSASILGMGKTIITQFEIVNISTNVLTWLAKQSGETAHIAILKDYHTVYLNKIDSSHPVHLLSYIGRKNPIHCTSTGQVILAYKSEEYVEKVIQNGLTKYTPYTITDEKRLLNALAAIREQGYAVSKEEMHIGVSSIAAPVKELTGEVIASVSIAGPTSRIISYKTNALIQYVKKAAKAVSKELIEVRKKQAIQKGQKL